MVDCISSHGKKWVKVDAVSVLVLLVLGACAGCIHQEEKTEEAPVLEDYFRGDFTVTGEPVLNQEVEILFTVNPITDSVDSTIDIYLPEGIELVRGDLHWEGDLTKDTMFHMTIVVRPIQEGEWEIWSYVEGLLEGEAEKGRDYFLFFLTSRNSGEVSRTRFYPLSPEDKSIFIPVDIRLESVPSPNVGDEVVLTFLLLASEDAPNVQAVIVLPEEFILLDGTLEWSGNLEKEKEETFQIKIRTTERGRFEILGILTYNDEEWRYAIYIFVH